MFSCGFLTLGNDHVEKKNNNNNNTWTDSTVMCDATLW